MKFIFLIPFTIFFVGIIHPLYVLSLDEKQTGPEVINKACSRAPDKNLCHSVFQTSNKSSIMDLQALGYYALQAVSANASDATLLVKTYMDDETLETTLSDAMVLCSKTYIHAVEQIKDSMNAVVSKAYGDAQTWMKGVVNDVKVCDDGVKGKSEKGDEVSKRNQVVSLLCRNALSVVEVLLEELI